MTTAMPQNMQALAKANERRLGGARFRREVGELDSVEGLKRLAEALDEDMSEALGSLTLEGFLSAAHRMGRHRAERFARAAGLIRRSNTRMRDLTQRERWALAATLRSHKPDPRGHGRS